MTREIILMAGNQITAGGTAETEAWADGNAIEAFGLYAIDVRVSVFYSGAADAAAVLNVYSSPDGLANSWDTVPFDAFTIPLDAGNKVQRTVRIRPVGAYLKFELENPGSVNLCGAGGYMVAGTPVTYTPGSLEA